MPPEVHGSVTLLGRFQVTRDGADVDALKSRPTCAALLAFLAAEGSVTREEAAAVLWPDADAARSRHSLSQIVYQLRKELGRDWIVSRGQEIRLADGIEVDALLMESAFRRGAYREAVDRFGGRFLPGWHLRSTVPFEEWVGEKERHYLALHREACRRHIASCIETNDTAGAVETARRWVEVEPTLEEATAELLRSLIAADSYHAAVEAYELYARRLAELGGVPGPQVVSLVASARARLHGDDDGMPEPPGLGSTPRVLVLPLEHVGPDELAYLTDGLTDDLTLGLSRHPDLAVIARPSALRVAQEGGTLVEIGRQLQVDSVLEGRVRWSGSSDTTTARTEVQHVRIADGAQLWSVKIETEAAELGAVQVRIIRGVRSALGLRPHPTGEDTATRDPDRSPAYELCVRGIQHWHRRSEGGLREAADLFIRAIEADPRYPRAYGCLALAYAMIPSFLGASRSDWIPRARRSAEMALHLDPDLVEGRLAMGIIAYSSDLDFEAAGRHWQFVLEREPGNVQALVWQAYRWTALGNSEQGRRCAINAVDLDPLSVSVNFDAGLVHWNLRDETEALEQMRKVLRMDPAFSPAAFILGAWHMRRGELDRTRREWTRIDLFGPTWTSFVDSLVERERAVAALDRIVELAPGPVHWYATAALYTLLDEPGRALHCLETHFRNVRGEAARFPTGGPGLFLVARDPLFDSLRGTQRFGDLMRALGLPSSD